MSARLMQLRSRPASARAITFGQLRELSISFDGGIRSVYVSRLKRMNETREDVG